MKIRTIGQLDIFLDSLSSWRKKELTQLRFAVSTSAGEQQRVFIRAAVTMLYAHWEGFVKDAATGYIQFVALQKLKIGNLTDNFIALALRSQIREAGQSSKTTAHIKLVKLFTTGLSNQSIIRWRQSVRTESNLTGRVLREITDTLGLDFTEYALKIKPVVERLVHVRNNIAHGRGMLVDEAEYVDLHSETISLLDKFKTQISDAASNRGFHR